MRSYNGSQAVSEQNKIRWMLTRIDGAKEARNMEPDELAEWMIDLKESGTAFSSKDLRKVAGAQMMREQE